MLGHQLEGMSPVWRHAGPPTGGYVTCVGACWATNWRAGHLCGGMLGHFLEGMSPVWGYAGTHPGLNVGNLCGGMLGHLMEGMLGHLLEGMLGQFLEGKLTTSVGAC